jgi:hypothetical protein
LRLIFHHIDTLEHLCCRTMDFWTLGLLDLGLRTSDSKHFFHHLSILSFAFFVTLRLFFYHIDTLEHLCCRTMDFWTLDFWTFRLRTFRLQTFFSPSKTSKKHLRLDFWTSGLQTFFSPSKASK